MLDPKTLKPGMTVYWITSKGEAGEVYLILSVGTDNISPNFKLNYGSPPTERAENFIYAYNVNKKKIVALTRKTDSINEDWGILGTDLEYINCTTPYLQSVIKTEKET